MSQRTKESTSFSASLLSPPPLQHLENWQPRNHCPYLQQGQWYPQVVPVKRSRGRTSRWLREKRSSTWRPELVRKDTVDATGWLQLGDCCVRSYETRSPSQTIWEDFHWSWSFCTIAKPEIWVIATNMALFGSMRWKHFGFASCIFQSTFEIKQTNVIIRRVQIETLAKLHYLLFNVVFLLTK